MNITKEDALISIFDNRDDIDRLTFIERIEIAYVI